MQAARLKLDQLEVYIIKVLSAESGDIGILNTADSLKQAKCFIMIDFLL